jgi:hypothetical protein
MGFVGGQARKGGWGTALPVWPSVVRMWGHWRTALHVDHHFPLVVATVPRGSPVAVYCDASTTGGGLVMVHPNWDQPLVVGWPWHFPHSHRVIFLLELLAWLVAAFFVGALIHPTEHPVRFWIDNRGLTQALRKRHCRLPTGNTLMRVGLTQLAAHNWKGEWVPSEDNHADAPSRWWDPP